MKNTHELLKNLSLIFGLLGLLGPIGSVSPAKAGGAESAEAVRARGAYLVAIGACNDCHTPLAMGPEGPAPDMSRMLSGHPEGMILPAPPALGDGPWLAVGSATNTAWAGPWGVSFTANLTPDRETGLGSWTEQDFVAMARTGRHLGKGRPILPPMPTASLAAMTDEDLHAMFVYLQSIPALSNRVPAPIPPAGS